MHRSLIFFFPGRLRRFTGIRSPNSHCRNRVEVGRVPICSGARSERPIACSDHHIGQHCSQGMPFRSLLHKGRHRGIRMSGPQRRRANHSAFLLELFLDISPKKTEASALLRRLGYKLVSRYGKHHHYSKTLSPTARLLEALKPVSIDLKVSLTRNLVEFRQIFQPTN